MAYHYIQYFECVKTFLGVTKVTMKMRMKITLMIMKKDDDDGDLRLLSVSKLSSVSLQAAARPSTSARKSERVLGAWVVLGWLIHWLVGWSRKRMSLSLLSLWFLVCFLISFSQNTQDRIASQRICLASGSFRFGWFGFKRSHRRTTRVTLVAIV